MVPVPGNFLAACGEPPCSSKGTPRLLSATLCTVSRPQFGQTLTSPSEVSPQFAHLLPASLTSSRRDSGPLSNPSRMGTRSRTAPLLTVALPLPHGFRGSAGDSDALCPGILVRRGRGGRGSFPQGRTRTLRASRSAMAR